MYKQNKQLVSLIGPVVDAMGYELLGIEYINQGRFSLLRLYIDKDGGIGLADCENVSHQVTGILDVEDPIQGKYNLEVSSPGLDRPLFTLEQFKRHLGEEVRLNLATKLDGRKKFNGRIADVVNECVVIEAEGNRIEIPAEAIQQARIIPGALDFKFGENKREH